jgi:hypothetical protein
MRKVLVWTGWPIVRKAQVIAATLGFLLTILVYFMPSLTAERSPLTEFQFALWMYFATPTLIVQRTTGMGPHWWVIVIEVVINTLLFLLLGTLVGFVCKLVRKTTRRDDHAI